MQKIFLALSITTSLVPINSYAAAAHVFRSTFRLLLKPAAIGLITSMPCYTFATSADQTPPPTSSTPHRFASTGGPSAPPLAGVKRRRPEDLDRIIIYATWSHYKQSAGIASDFFDAAREYHAASPEKCKETLFHAVEELNEFPDSDSLKTLALLNELYPDAFLELAQKISDTKTEALIKAFIKSPDVALLFIDTPISLKQLIANVLAQNSSGKASSDFQPPLRYILENIHLFPEYHAAILDAMPTILEKGNAHSANLLPFLKLERGKADHAFALILRNIDRQTDDSWDTDLLINRLFGDHCNFLKGQPIAIYDDLYAIFKRHEFFQAQQILWTHLSEETADRLREAYHAKLRTQFLDFWNVPAADMDMRLPWGEFCHQVLMKTIHEKTVPLTRVHAFIETAKAKSTWGKANRFYQMLCPELLETVSNSLLWDDAASLKDRVESLTNQVLRSQATLASSAEGRERFMVGIVEPELRAYAENILALCKSNITNYEAAQRKLFMIQFKQRHPEISIPWDFTNLYNIHSSESKKPEDTAKPFVFLENSWSLALQPHVDDTFIYGIHNSDRLHNLPGAYDEKNLELHACDPVTGYSKWWVSFKSPVHSEYGIANQPYKYYTTKDHVILVVDRQITILNKEDGSINKQFNIAPDGELKSIHVNESGLIFMAFSNKETVKIKALKIDTLEEKFSVTESANPGVGRFYPASRFLIRETAYRRLSIYDESGHIKIVETCHLPEDSPDRRFIHMRFSTHDHFLYYQEIAADGKLNLVKYDVDSGAIVSKMAIPTEMISNPKISPDGRKLFYFSNDKKLVAINTTSLLWGLSTLWSADIKSPTDSCFAKIDSFAISPTGDKIFAINNIINDELFSYDTETGAENNLGKMLCLGRGKKLIGFTPRGQVVIAPYSFQ